MRYGNRTGRHSRVIMMSAKKLNRALVFMLVAISQTGCGDSDTYVSFGGRSLGQPVFCISQKANCAAPGAPLSALTVKKIGSQGNGEDIVWEVTAANSAVREQRQITYGVTPVGWNMKAVPRQLLPGQHYSVNDQYFFSITPNGLILNENRR